MKLVKSLWFVLVLMLTIVGVVKTAYAQGGDVSRGQQLYIKNCAVCHGDRAEGRIGATLAKDFPGIRVDALLKETISNGVKGSVMPSWAKANGGPLADSDIDDLVAFIRSLGNQGPPVLKVPTPTRAPLPPTVVAFPAGDVPRGSTVFTQNCVVCHGDKGEGRVGATLQKDWSGINVDALIEATVARGVAGTKMPAWAKSNGGPLTDQDIADVTAFVRTLKPARAPVATPTETSPGGSMGGVFALVCVGVLLLFGVVALVFVLSNARKPTASA
jgi:mono/diheme cytochrome c family protein